MDGFIGFTVTPGSFVCWRQWEVMADAGGETKLSEQHSAVHFTSHHLWAVGALNPQLQLDQHWTDGQHCCFKFFLETAKSGSGFQIYLETVVWRGAM